MLFIFKNVPHCLSSALLRPSDAATFGRMKGFLFKVLDVQLHT